MTRPSIPVRFPPLAWRRPYIVWTPAALALALGWPALALGQTTPLAGAALGLGALTLAIALVTLGVAWAIGKPPRTRHAALNHFLIAGLLVSLAAPFALTRVIEALQLWEWGNVISPLPTDSAFALAPLALLIGLPSALFFGVIFAGVALIKPPRIDCAPRTQAHAPNHEPQERVGETVG